MGHILPFNKPEDWTSFDVVNKLRNMTRVKKVGHAGTLDPFATGLLLICFGKATKQVEGLMNLEKEYVGTVALGVETDSHDVTGKVVKDGGERDFTAEEIAGALSSFTGEIEQIPPMFSAIRHKGKRLYELARQGEVVERKAKAVTIYELHMLSLKDGELELKIRCSRGTYIRALARDIGRALGTFGYLKSLVRTRIGKYTLEDSYSIQTFSSNFVA